MKHREHNRFRLYEWNKRIIDSCLTQGQCNTAEMVLWRSNLGFAFFCELRERLYRKEISFIDNEEDREKAESQKMWDKSWQRMMDPEYQEIARANS